MVWKQNSTTPGKRNERHSAAWGKRLSLAVLLLSGTVFGQPNAASLRGMKASDRLDPEVTKIMSRFAARPSQQVKVIVQYKQAPKTAAFFLYIFGQGATVAGADDCGLLAEALQR